VGQPRGRRERARRGATGSGDGPGRASPRRVLDDRDFGAAVVEEELVLAGRHERVEGHRDGTELHRAPERRREGGRVVKDEEDAVLDLHARGREHAGGAIDALGQLRVADRATREAQRRAPAPSAGHVTIDEEGGGVEALGDVHDLPRFYQGGVDAGSRSA